MGIPAFYGWLSQRYRRITRRTLEDTVDNLYVDVNGLIHQACQEQRGVYLHDEDEMLVRLVACLDRLLALTGAANLVFLAVDGVAPRAKLNQQRGRRFGSAKARAQEAEEGCGECEGDVFAFDDDTDAVPSPADVAATQGELEDVAKGLKRGIYGGDEGAADDLLAGLAAAADDSPDDDAGVAGLGLFGGFGEDEDEAGVEEAGGEEEAAAAASPSAPAAAPLRWDSNAITPGTAFMERVADTLRVWAAAKAEEKGLTVVVSDSNTPGEGEHKFIDFVKAEKAWWQARGGGAGGWFDPNASHAVVSLDADIVLLSLSLHLPRVYVVREDRKSPPLTKFEYCSIDILRECLAEELVGKAAKYADHFASEAAAKQKLSEHRQVVCDRRRQAYLRDLDFERLLDDFIYMLSLCGNDFVPHLPSAYLGQNAGDTLIDVYARTVGRTVFEASESASHPAPEPYLAGNAGNDLSNLLKLLENYGTLEDALFRGESAFQKQIPHNFYGTHDGVWREAYYGSVRKMMGVAAEADGGVPLQTFVDGMCRAWVEAVVWVGEYYGRPDTASWSWYYPYYHAPFASDVAAYLRVLRDGDALGSGGQGCLKIAPSELFPLDAPLQPKQQLLSVLPAASFHLLPDGYGAAFYKAHRAEYPASWPFDLTGCRAEYHGVAVLPFLDAAALRAATDAHTPSENVAGHLVYRAAAKERVRPLTFAGHDLGRGGCGAPRTLTARAVAPADVSARYGAWGAASRHSDVRAVDRPCYVPWKLAAAAAAAGGVQGALRRTAAALHALCDALGVVFLVAAGVWAAARRLRQGGRRSLLGEVAMVALAAGLARVMRREVLKRRGAAAAAAAPRARKWEKQKDVRKVSALEFFKPKRVRTDWVCRACKCCNWERQTSCFNESCKAVRLVTCPVVYLPKGNVWSPTCYTADHLPQSTTR